MVCKAIKFKIMERGYLPKVFIGSDHRVDMDVYVFSQKNFQTNCEIIRISYAKMCKSCVSILAINFLNSITNTQENTGNIIK